MDSFLLNLKNNSIIRMKKKEYISLKNGFFSDISKEDILLLKNNGFLLIKEEDDFYSVNDLFMREYRVKNKYNKFNIMLTDYCNLACSYCYMNGEKNQREMSTGIVDKLVLFIKKVVSFNGDKRIILDYSGGEAFLNFKVLLYLVNEIREMSLKEGVEIISQNITTNCALDVSEHVSFLNDNNIKLRTSLCLYPSDSISRNFKCGEDSKEYVLNQIKSIIDQGYKFPIEVLWLMPEGESSKKDIKDRYMKEFVSKGIDISKVYLKEDCIEISSNYDGFKIKKKDNFSFSDCKNVISAIKDNEEFDGMFARWVCCAYREDFVFTIFPDGKVSNYSGGYQQEDFLIGDVDSEIDTMMGKIKEIKENGAWKKDKKCLSCPVLPKCFGGCVCSFHPHDKNTPSLSCCQKTKILKNKMIFKQFVKKVCEIETVLGGK